jgi:predicted esterase
LIVMPGGDGSADFHPFVRRIYKHALGEDFLIAQPVAVQWHPNQKIVWPTRKNKVAGQRFATEDFVNSVVEDVAAKHKLDRNAIFTLSWSSSGPAAYAIALAKKTPVTGSYIAMSVFKPNDLPPLENGKGRVFYIEHSPEDQVCPFRMAEEAKESLEKAGATVHFNTYDGGHGWLGDVFGRVRSGVDWLALEEAAKQK